MCYQVKCGTCGKPTWAGCGRHVASAHAQIPEGQHCACRDWQGVEKKKAGDATAAATAAASTTAAEGSTASTTQAGATQ